MWLPAWLACADATVPEDPAGPLPAVNGTCAPEGLAFVEHSSCDGVEGQPPTTTAPAASQVSSPDPARLEDPDLAWSEDQLASCSCVCCHTVGGIAGYAWAADFAPAWTDSADDARLEALAGPPPHFVEAVPPEENYGFDRGITGMPTTDPERMLGFLERELARRAAAP